MNASFPDEWQKLADDLDLDVRPSDPPDGATTEVHWFDLLRRFGDEGFLRALAAPGTSQTTLRVELAPPREDLGPEWIQTVASKLEARSNTPWDVHEDGPPWTIEASIADGPDYEILAPFFAELVTLGDHISSPDAVEPPDWLKSSAGSNKEAASPDDESRKRDTLFETIGDDDDDTGETEAAPGNAGDQRQLTGHGSDARIDDADIVETDGGLEATITLDRDVSTSELEALGRGLAHTLRARFGVTARSVPADIDAESGQGPKSLSVRIDEMDSDRAASFDATEIAGRLEDYFDRLERFSGHGLALADVLGLGESHQRSNGTDRRRTSSPQSRPSADSEPSDEPLDSGESGEVQSDQGVVLNLEPDPSDEPRRAPDQNDSDETVLQGHDSGLKAGNYTDPRLKREDAQTALVDVVLRHPGYAERRMAHNLGILLDIDFTDSMELVQDAPCLIAWGVGRERGLRFKRVIENAGGKVVLVEPETFTPAE